MTQATLAPPAAASAAPSSLRIDVTGETCPVPLIEARKALARVPVGGRVEIVGDHDSSFKEIPLLARNLGHDLLVAEGDAAAWRFVLERRR